MSNYVRWPVPGGSWDRRSRAPVIVGGVEPFTGGPTTVTVPLLTHSYTALAPQVQVRVQPGPLTHTYTAIAPQVRARVAVPGASHIYTAHSPQAQVRVQPGTVDQTYNAVAPAITVSVNVRPDPVAHTYTANAPQVQSRVEVGAVSHSYTAHAPQARSSVAVAAVQHTYNAQDPQVQSRVQPGLASHTYTARAPVVTAGAIVRPPTGQHTYTSVTPQVRASVMPGPASHTYTTIAPTASTPTNVAVPVVAHTYTAIVPDVQFTPGVPSKPQPGGRRFPGGYRPGFIPLERELPELEGEKEPEIATPAPAAYEVWAIVYCSADATAEESIAAVVEAEVSVNGSAMDAAAEISSQPAVMMASSVEVSGIAQHFSARYRAIGEGAAIADATAEIVYDDGKPRGITDQEALDILRKLV